MSLWGIWGRPYLDLTSVLDTAPLAAIDEEIQGALPHLAPGWTGGTLQWMNVVAPWQRDDPHRDAMDAVRSMSREERRAFVAMNPDVPPLEEGDDDAPLGDETDRPFNHAQCVHLAERYGAYFPWKTCVHLVENDRWEDKHSGAGKRFSDECERWLPRTVAYVRALPFREIGRAVLFGVHAGDHAPFHRDAEPGRELSIAQSISIDPRGDKGLVLRGPDGGDRVLVKAKLYWFNDMDYHGVEARDRFRYSLRVDGVFQPEFARRLRRAFG
ncbi:MAG: hypothetical protein IT374_15050 [Polyangiaceae bacterium]|nr:hypothetical protein [Polyangiaceae bacterium]